MLYHPVHHDRPRTTTHIQQIALNLLFLTLLLVPCINIIPRIPVLDVSPLGLIGGSLVAIATVQAVTPSRRDGRAVKYLRVLFLCIMSTVILSVDVHGLKPVLTETIVLSAFLSALVICSHADTVTLRTRGMSVLLVANALGSFVALLAVLNIIHPIYAPGLSFTTADRTAAVTDGFNGVLGAAAACYRLSQPDTRLPGTVWCITSIGLGFLNIVLSGTRAYFGAFCLFVGIYMFRQFLKKRSNGRAALIAALIALGIGVYVDPMGKVQAMKTRLATTSADGELLRQREGELTMALISERPIAGWGWGISSERKVEVHGWDSMPLWGHNLYLSFMARLGIPCALSLIAAWLFLLRRCIRRWIHTTEEGPKSYAFCTCLLMILSMAVCLVTNLATMSPAFIGSALFLAPHLLTGTTTPGMRLPGAGRRSRYMIFPLRRDPSGRPL
jgi:O-antigen ligase